MIWLQSVQKITFNLCLIQQTQNLMEHSKACITCLHLWLWESNSKSTIYKVMFQPIYLLVLDESKIFWSIWNRRRELWLLIVQSLQDLPVNTVNTYQNKLYVRMQNYKCLNHYISNELESFFTVHQKITF